MATIGTGQIECRTCRRTGHALSQCRAVVNSWTLQSHGSMPTSTLECCPLATTTSITVVSSPVPSWHPGHRSSESQIGDSDNSSSGSRSSSSSSSSSSGIISSNGSSNSFNNNLNSRSSSRSNGSNSRGSGSTRSSNGSISSIA